MTTILHIDASSRSPDNALTDHRSISRSLALFFKAQWQTYHDKDIFIYRDVGRQPPPFIDESWISAAFTPEVHRTQQQNKVLALSDELISEVEKADLILMSTPMYNYGMPATLKAWFDQVIRVNKTFSFDLGRGDFPLEPMFSSKTMVLLTSSGEFGFGPGEPRSPMNHLGPHIRVVSKYLGVETFHEVRVEYQEFGDERHSSSIKQAHNAIKKLVSILRTDSLLSLARTSSTSIQDKTIGERGRRSANRRRP